MYTFYETDLGYCRVYFKFNGRALRCYQNEGRNNWLFYPCTNDGEPISPMEPACSFEHFDRPEEPCDLQQVWDIIHAAGRFAKKLASSNAGYLADHGAKGVELYSYAHKGAKWAMDARADQWREYAVQGKLEQLIEWEF